jgi:hypothetical protein
VASSAEKKGLFGILNIEKRAISMFKDPKRTILTFQLPICQHLKAMSGAFIIKLERNMRLKTLLATNISLETISMEFYVS